MSSQDFDYDDEPLFTRGCAKFKQTYSRASTKRSTGKSSIILTVPASIASSSTAVKRDILVPQYLQVYFFATILEDALTQFRILGECNNHNRIFKTQADLNYLRRDKYGVIRSVNADELYDIDPSKLHSEHYKINKLEADRKNCMDILMATYLDMALNNTFSPLLRHRESIENRNNYRQSLIEEEARNKQTYRELARQLRQQRNRVKTAVYETNARVDNLQRQVENAALNEEARERYIGHWQNSRCEQHSHVLQTEEDERADTISVYRRKTEEEHRAHTELELINNIRINDILRDIDMWMTKYDQDIEAVEVQVQLRKVDVNYQKAARLELEKKLADHEIEINNWKQFKIDREKARLQSIKMLNAAIAVQAWWRGLLVRLQLGPYRPTKKPVKPKPKEKKKKGKSI